ncbi:hypothetical protein G113_18674 [Aeromonas molluscorum 848]|uniref:Uncharacterized protein n=1 Tax=Aeromonas molluscorum 848 TaxID=1268236 RepID=R1F0U2_9GAMM|nr:hypothetical protein G113_18674 [Aeromonas molluscorum 848]
MSTSLLFYYIQHLIAGTTLIINVDTTFIFIMTMFNTIFAAKSFLVFYQRMNILTRVVKYPIMLILLSLMNCQIFSLCKVKCKTTENLLNKME